MTCSRVGAVELHHGMQVHMVEWVRDDQSDFQIIGVEASRGSAPQRSTLSSWRHSGDQPHRVPSAAAWRGQESRRPFQRGT